MPVHRLLYNFRVREDSARAKFLAFLFEHSSKQMPYSEVMDAVYGKKKGSKSAFNQLISKMDATIRSRGLNYEIKREKGTRGRTIGLYLPPLEADDRELVAAGGTIAALNSKVWEKG